MKGGVLWITRAVVEYIELAKIGEYVVGGVVDVCCTRYVCMYERPQRRVLKGDIRFVVLLI